MNREVNELLDKLGSMEDAPLIWINQRVENLITENKQLKEDCKNLMNIINNNCSELNTTKEEFESLKRWDNE